MKTATDDGAPGPRVIAVALDATTDCRAMLEASAALADRLGASLRGVWVQDDDLLRLAGLPFVRELAYASASPRPLNSRSLDETMTRLQRRLERSVAQVAARRRVVWELRSRRGAVVPTLADEAEGTDLVVVGRVKRVHHARAGSGQTALSLAARSPVPVLVLPSGKPVAGPIVVVAAGDDTVCGRLGGLVAGLASAAAGQIVVLVPPGREGCASQLGQRFGAAGLAWRAVRLMDDAAGAIGLAVRRSGAGVAVLPSTDAGPELARDIAVPLVLVPG